MMQRLAITTIKQLDNHRFQITWNDGIESHYRLSDLQGHCPCAGCVDEATNQRKPSATPIALDVKAKVIQSVGRYALRIQFTSGCSAGIYDYVTLRQLSSLH